MYCFLQSFFKSEIMNVKVLLFLQIVFRNASGQRKNLAHTWYRSWLEILILRTPSRLVMLVPEGNLTSWASNWTTLLHQVSCNDTLFGCAGECDIVSSGFDHLCTTIEKGTFTSSSRTLFCTPCDYASCNVNVSLLLNGLESIEGVFLSRIPIRNCNATSIEEEVSPVRDWRH